MRIHTAKAFLLTTAATALLLAPGAAFAAEASTTGAVEEIIVTAQRRAERLEDVPMSITAITPAAAENKGIHNLQDLGQTVAGVQINFSGFATQPTIRGVSALANNVGLENNVAVYIDGFYQDDTSTINADFANLDSIQVLKGPQGTLYGRNATGGAFLLSTKAPSKDYEGKIDLRYGSFNDRSASGYVSGPITDRIRFSLAGFARNSDGYYDLLNSVGQKIGHAAPIESYSIRAKLQIDLTDKLTAMLAYNYTELQDPRGLMFTLESLRSAAVPPKVGRLYEPRTFATNHNGNEQFDQLHQPTLTLTYDTPIGKLTSYTGTTHSNVKQLFDVDGSYADLNYQNVRYFTDNFQENVDWNITSIPKLDLDVGATYWANRVKSPFGLSIAGNALATRSQSSRITHSWAAFVDASYHLTDKLVVNLGARYTDETTRIGSTTFLGSGALAAPPLSQDANGASFTNFSPRGSIRYQLAENTNVYASITRGFRSGYPQAIATSGTYLFFPVQPEEITAYETGYKTVQRNFRFDAAAYYYDYTNLQVGSARLNPLVPNTTLTFTTNAPKAEIYGAEAQVTWTPVDHMIIDLSGAWIHARYTDFPAATGTGLNVTTGLNAPGQLQNWNGQQMARAPNFSATLGASYEFVDVFGGSLLAQGNVKYTESYVTNNPSLFGPLDPPVATMQRFRQPSYTLLNASLTWTDPSKHYKVGVFADNITDVDYHLSINALAFGQYGTWAPPRSYGIRLGYQF
jgi:iron complex outermembrane receptor protein